MKKITSGINSLKPYLLSKQTKRGLLALAVLVVLDAAVAVVATVFIHQPVLLMLSNLLFLEGAITFTIGSFIAFIRTSPRRKEKEKTEEKEGQVLVSKERAEEYLTPKSTPVRMPIGPLLILLGVILIALSVVTLQVLLLV